MPGRLVSRDRARHGGGPPAGTGRADGRARRHRAGRTPPEERHEKSALALIAAAATLTAAAHAGAQEAEPDAPGVEAAKGVEKPNSVNVSPLGIAFGSYAVNYERLFDGGHGVLVEGQLSMSSGDDADSTSYGGVVGYRYHFNGTQDSWFAGVNLGYSAGTGDGVVEVTSNGSTTTRTFPVDFSLISATANVGHRWSWDFGLNVTLRFGAGYGAYSFSTDSEDDDAQLAVEAVDALLTAIPVAFDGELSVGFNF